MLFLGFSFSIFAASIWPCISYLVDAHQVGTALGFMSVSFNFSLFLCPLLIAHIQNSSITSTSKWSLNLYDASEVFFMVLAGFAGVCGVLLVVGYDSVLNSVIRDSKKEEDALRPFSPSLSDDESILLESL
jgi:MFS family permease